MVETKSDPAPSGRTGGRKPKGPHRPFWAKVDKTETCWLWTGYLDRNGYGRAQWQKRQDLAHRVAYRHLVGEIPADLSLDHLCRVRHCVNPDHLEPVTTAENVRRGHQFRATAHLRSPEEVLAMTDAVNPPDTEGRRRLTYTLKEAAEILGIRESWLRAKVHAREVPFIQAGKVSIAFTGAQLDEILGALTAKPKKDPQSLTSSRAKKRAA